MVPREERVLNGWLCAAIWVVTRVVMGMVWDSRARFIDFDVGYYFRQIEYSASMTSTLVEYPTPVVWLLQLMHFCSGGNAAVFMTIFTSSMFALDGALAIMLWFRAGRAAALYWTGFLFMIGPLIWFRLDLIPAAVVALACVWLVRRPLAAGAMIALGAAIKLWPALLILPVFGPHRAGRDRAIGFVLIGGALGGASWLAHGWQRSISPITWQSDRGLQIESVLASWPMYEHAFPTPPLGRIFLSRYNAWEIAGVDDDLWLRLGTIGMVAAAGFAVLLCWLIGFGGAGLPGHSLAGARHAPSRLRHSAMLTAIVAIICAVLVANKTLSPQYVIWLAGPLALLVAQRGREGRHRFHAVGLAVLGMLVALLTQFVFPLNYGGLLRNPRNDAATTVLLLIRNGALVVLGCWSALRALALAWRVGDRQWALAKMS